MIPTQAPLDGPAILFARGGASGHEAADTAAAFLLARRLGATGIETGLTATADGTPVLRRDPRVGGLRKRRIADLAAADLPADVVTLDAFYGGDGLADLDLLVHVTAADPGAAVSAAVELATEASALHRLWLCSTDRAALTSWRSAFPGVRLVDASVPVTAGPAMERHAAELRRLDIDAVLFQHADWSGGRTALFHRFGRRCFATDALHERMITAMLVIGIDGVASTHPDRLVDAAAAVGAAPR